MNALKVGTVAIAVYSLFNGRAYAIDQLDLYSRRCLSLDDSNGRQKIDSCLSLLPQLDNELKGGVYTIVAATYVLRFEDLDKAIDYQLKALQAEGDQPPKPRPDRTPELNRFSVIAYYARKSEKNYRMGWYLDFKAKTLPGNGSSEMAVSLSQRALSYLTLAVALNRLNHEAYAARAELYAKYCRSMEAESDKATAVRIARQQDNESVMRNYAGLSLASCAPENRGLLK